MKLYLNVPFAEKEEAKRLGARWNPELKLWFVEIKDTVPSPLYRWLIEEADYNLLAEDYSIVMASKPCWKCHEQTIVTTFILDRYYELVHFDVDEGETFFYNWQDVHNLSFVSNITALDPSVLAKMGEANSHYRKTYSKALEGSYFANNCTHCGMLQGDFNLYQEPSSIFYDCRDSEKFEKIITIDKPFKAKGNTALTAGSPEGIMIKIVGS
ncbi:DUF5710 domain-containing protein [Ignatzschineria rhizosphaerae]|uniref:DUF5710 domain-containing protein n=1 Tax=Ignatzschineria rhizosphaerae TaxID=2923279 RepID=A0ABY3X2W4_9GAMM|nr:DUF5710 domain-containing protein [Ignatzschineria rhizosphaerae]UNM97223.1 DUF5710 domain-containing protein [Ignatzschineria rhizosphaerae]